MKNSCFALDVSVLRTLDDVTTLVQQLDRSNLATDGTLILHFCRETLDLKFLPVAFPSLTSSIKQRIPTAKLLIVANRYFESQFDFSSYPHVDDVLFIDYWMMVAHKKIMVDKICEHVESWDHASHKFLFLTGKPQKLHRIGLLNQIEKFGLIDRCNWSLFMDANAKTQCRALLLDLTDEEYDRFIQSHVQTLDSISINYERGLHYGGMPFDKKIYQDCLFQVISETNFDNSVPWITEKTWLSMINHRPFIMASSTGTLARLKNMGFKTFDEYLPVPCYDNIDDPQQRIRAILTNTNFWLSNITDYKQSIIRDIEHNYSRFLQLADLNQNQIAMFAEQNQITDQIDKIVILEDIYAHADWVNWYDRIKDQSWPDCATEDDFECLPEWIQQECIEVFGYVPKKKNLDRWQQRTIS